MWRKFPGMAGRACGKQICCCEYCLLNRQKNSTLALWSHLRNWCPNNERVAQKKITISLPRIFDIGKEVGDTASYPESSRKQDFKLISALISFALFSIYIQVQATVCLLCLFSFPCIYRSTFDSITLTIISSYQKIKYNCLVSQLYRLAPFGRGYRTEMLLFGAMQYWAYNWTIFFLKVVIIIIICFLGNFPNITRSCISRLRKKSHLFPKFGKKCHSWISQCADGIIFLVQGNDPHIYKLRKKGLLLKLQSDLFQEIHKFSPKHTPKGGNYALFAS